MNRKGRVVPLPMLSAYAIGMAFVESAVVVYLRNTLLDVWTQNPSPLLVEEAFRRSGLYRTEQLREAATIVMNASVAWLGGVSARSRAGAFLWVFGLWDLVYYAFLYLLLAWPESLLAMDVLFLIPGPWIAPVGVPVVISAGFLAIGIYLWNSSSAEAPLGDRSPLS